MYSKFKKVGKVVYYIHIIYKFSCSGADAKQKILTLDIFQIINQKCLILDNAVARYKAVLNNLYQISQREIKNRESWSQEKDIKFMFRRYRVEKVAREENRKYYLGNILGLNIDLTRPCDEYPKLGMNENCKFMSLY